MTDWSGPEAIAATLLVLLLVGGLVSTLAMLGLWIIEMGEGMLEERQSHEYHEVIRPRQEADHSEWLATATDAITKLSKSRADGIVSADDVWDICPPPDGVDPRVMGAIWQPRDRWQIVGYEPSRRPINHKRRIAQWKFLTLEEMREAAE